MFGNTVQHSFPSVVSEGPTWARRAVLSASAPTALGKTALRQTSGCRAGRSQLNNVPFCGWVLCTPVPRGCAGIHARTSARVGSREQHHGRPQVQHPQDGVHPASVRRLIAHAGVSGNRKRHTKISGPAYCLTFCTQWLERRCASLVDHVRSCCCHLTHFVSFTDRMLAAYLK